MSKRLVDTQYLNDLELLYAEVSAVDSVLKIGKERAPGFQSQMERSAARITEIKERLDAHVDQ